MKTKFAIAMAVIICLCFLGAPSSADNKPDLVQGQFAAWNSHDPDKVVSFYTDDVVYEDIAFGLKAQGQEQLRRLAADFFTGVPDMKLEVISSTSMGNRGSVEWVFSGTDVGIYKTGKKFSVRGASVYEIRGGKFSSNRDYYDSANIMRQVGILPTTPR
jgi:steroid delta-isomerase-like uncharacterized protein